MRIGVLVDGDAEFYALPHLWPRLGSPCQVLRTLKCDIQPFASPALMAHVASKRFPILLKDKVEWILVLIDKENHQGCTGELVQIIEREMRARLVVHSKEVGLSVVLKVSKFENWMASDPEALRALSGMFKEVEKIEKQVTSNRADLVDALKLLKICARKCRKDYDKVGGAVAICKKLDPVRAAANSRSFRKLLKVLECPGAAPEDRSPGQARRSGRPRKR